MSTGKKLAQTAQMLAERPFHGRTEDQPSNLLPIVRLFPKWNLEQAERMWCAAFVYYCCIQAGFSIPYSPQECRSCSLAGCGGWEEFAQGDKRIAYYDGQQAIRDADFVWQSVMQILSGRKGISCCMTGCLSTESTTILVFC